MLRMTRTERVNRWEVPTIIPWYMLGGVTPHQVEGIYVAKSAASLNASLINIHTPGVHNAIDISGGSMSFSPLLGWWFAGKGGGIDTTCVPASNWTVIVRYGAAFVGYYFGIYDNMLSKYFWVKYDIKSASYDYTNGSSSIGSAFVPNSTVGISQWQAYLNGVPDGPPIVSPSWTTILSIYLGCLNFIGVPSSFGSGYMLAVAIYNTPLTPTQMNLIMTAMNAL